MGHSQADKAESHDRIVRMAAARFREDGVDGIGMCRFSDADENAMYWNFVVLAWLPLHH